MLDGYHILTLTHRDASLEAIGQAVLPGDEAPQTLQHLKNHFGWDELLYLATCNRVAYLFYTQTPVSERLAMEILAVAKGDNNTNIEKIAAQARLLHGADAIRHLLEVASSMDSLVVGEREIIRQLRQAYDQSRAWGLTGDHLRLLMRFTVETAKEIYSQTGIGEKALSIVALAFAEMQKSHFSENARILMVGAGQTNALFSKFLAKKGCRNVTVFNRTLSRAENIARNFENGRALPLEALEFYSEGFDALIVCTGATHPVVTLPIYRALLAGENSKKTVVDLAVPSNVDKKILTIFPTQLIEIESLKDVALKNLAHREQERSKAEAIIKSRIFSFRELWHERQVERSLSHIPDEVRAVKERALNEVFAKEFARLDGDTQKLVLEMLGYMEKKCVAIPIKAAKAITLHGRKKEMQKAAHE